MSTSPSGKTVLFVAGEFPPIKTIGRIRTTKFVEHLQANGWEPIVLSIEPRAGMPGYVPELAAEVPRGIEVHRAAWPDLESRIVALIKRLLARPVLPDDVSNMPSKSESNPPAVLIRSPRRAKELGLGVFKWILKHWIQVPDSYKTWAERAQVMAEGLFLNRHIDAVFITLPPFSAAEIGYRLKQRFGVPLILDYRDLWYGDVLREWIGPLRQRIELGMERRFVRSADVVIAVSEEKTEFLQQLHPGTKARWITLTNGYDPEIYGPLLAEPRRENGVIDFVFTGRLFKNRRGYAFAESLGRIVSERPELKGRVRVHLLGGIAPEIRARYDEILGKLDIRDMYNFTGDIPYQEAMRAQVQADYLLLIVDTGATSSGVIPGKLFEYIAARRPIFALTDKGATQKIIERGRLGTVVPAESVEECEVALKQWLSREVPQKLDADWEYLSQFERGKISGRLEDLLDDVISASRGEALRQGRV